MRVSSALRIPFRRPGRTAQRRAADATARPRASRPSILAGGLADEPSGAQLERIGPRIPEVLERGVWRTVPFSPVVQPVFHSGRREMRSRFWKLAGRVAD